MEYEIRQEGEDALFDDSTNPSLRHEDDEALRRRHPVPADKRKLQKAELIPEEEEETQLA
jgi:hypothetical protein